jgi:CRP-like cAMP-binding protein
VVWSRGGTAPDAAGRNRIAQREVALRCVDLLRPLSQENLERLARLVENRLFAAHEVIIRQGEPGEEMFILLRGLVSVEVEQEGGNRVRAADLGPGSFFGEMSLMTGAPRTATVTALEECELLVVCRVAFREILEATPELSWRICQVMAERRVRQTQIGGEAAGAEGQDAAPETTTSGLFNRIRQFFALRD